MSKSTRIILATGAAIASLACFTAAANADTASTDTASATTASPAAATPANDWRKAHPRRAEVNRRLAVQDARIHREVKEGEIDHAQAHELHKEDHQIRQEERDMASQNGGHVTRLEKRTLNQQENAVSKQIGK